MRRRKGYTLIELLMATASATALMVGLSGALYVSAQALDSDDGALARRTNADNELSRLVADVREARRFQTLASNEIQFTVPDRDGDGLDDVVRYVWSGSPGDALQRRLNDGEFYDFLPDVRTLDFVKLARSVPALDVTVSPPPPWPVLEGFTDSKVDPKEAEIVLATPAGAAEGELLIATVATDNDKSGSMSAPVGWSPIDVGEQGGKTSLGAWWRLVEASEPATHTWTWSGTEEAIGLMLRISNQYLGTPVTTFTANGDKSNSATAPAAVTVLDHSMALRLVGTDKDSVSAVGVTGLPGHTDVYMDAAGAVSTGCGYEIVSVAGTAAAASFSLKNNTDYRALTVVIAPKQ